jgi:hypothetical protein
VSSVEARGEPNWEEGLPDRTLPGVVAGVELVGGGERNGSLPSLSASQRWTQVHCGSGKAAREKKVEAKECGPFNKKGMRPKAGNGEQDGLSKLWMNQTHWAFVRNRSRAVFFSNTKALVFNF